MFTHELICFHSFRVACVNFGLKMASHFHIKISNLFRCKALTSLVRAYAVEGLGSGFS